MEFSVVYLCLYSTKLTFLENKFLFCFVFPEILRCDPNGHDLAVDWWSVGVLTYELLTGSSPFTYSHVNNTQSDITQRIQTDTPNFPPNMNEVAKDFILKMLSKDPAKRLGNFNEFYKENKLI